VLWHFATKSNTVGVGRGELRAGEPRHLLDVILAVPLPHDLAVGRDLVEVRAEQRALADLRLLDLALAEDHRVAIGQALEIVVHLAGAKPHLVTVPVEFHDADFAVRRELGVEEQMAVGQEVAEVARPRRPLVHDVRVHVEEQEFARVVGAVKHVAWRGLVLVAHAQAVAAPLAGVDDKAVHAFALVVPVADVHAAVVIVPGLVEAFGGGVEFHAATPGSSLSDVAGAILAADGHVRRDVALDVAVPRA